MNTEFSRKWAEFWKVFYDPATARRAANARHRPDVFPHRRGVIVTDLFVRQDRPQRDQIPILHDPGIRRAGVICEYPRPSDVEVHPVVDL